MPQENQSPLLFDQALAQQQQKNWDAALTLYRQTLDLRLDAAQAASVYHNMSGIAFEKNDLFNAYVWSKKAFHLNPSNPLIRQSFEQYSSQYQIPSVPHQISNYDNFKKVLTYAPVDVWSATGLIISLAAIWLFFRKIVNDRKNSAAGIFTKTPLWPALTAAFFAVIFVSCAYLSYQDSVITRALVIAGPAPVQTAPGPEKPIIFEAPSGLEVEVLAVQNINGQNYFQIRYPGAFSGWILQSQLELLSLSFEQKNL